MVDESEALALKERGNERFKAGQLKEALDAYSKALGAKDKPKDLSATLHKNRAAVHLKLEDFAAADQDCSKALDLAPNDAKALFRRCQAREGLERWGDAFRDAKLALHYDPGNKAIQTTLQRLVAINQMKQKESLTTESRAATMMKVAFDSAEETEKRIKAVNNLVVLGREPMGAALLWAAGAAEKLLGLISTADDDEVVVAAQRALDELAKDEDRCLQLLEHLGINKVVRLMNHPRSSATGAKLVDAASLLTQRLFNTLAGMNRREDIKPDKDKAEKNKVTIVKLVIELEDMLMDPTVSVGAREAALDLLSKNLMSMDGGLPRGFSWLFAEERGIIKVLELSCCLPSRSPVAVSEETREHVAILLTRLYDDMVFDNKRSAMKEVVDKFVHEKLEKIAQGNKDLQIEVCCCITTLLLGPYDLGFSLISNTGITDMMLEMAQSEDLLSQTVAVELIVHTASKRDRASAIVAGGIPVLRKLYESKHEGIKARALVGLCKCASSGGQDASRQAMAEGSTTKLAQACRKLLISPGKSDETRRWAAEGLSYLTVDGDVKEWLIADLAVIRSLVDLAKRLGPVAVFGVASVFVNLTNTYDIPEPEPEMVELAKFNKQHVPEKHEKDEEEFVKDRIELLVREGATAACVALSQTESEQSRELLARVLEAFTRAEDQRGIVVGEGGAKLLVKLSLDGSEDCRTKAAQGLARIGIKMDPEIAFPGQRMYEIVRPLMNLLHIEKSGLQNYEALLTLTNLASKSDSVRRRILKEKGSMNKIEEYWFMQDHEDLRAAAAELLLNLVHVKEGREMATNPETDRLKLFLLYCAEEEERLVRSSTGAIAVLTQDDEVCRRIPKVLGSWTEVLKEAAMQGDAEAQYRALIAIANIMETEENLCAAIVASDLFEIMVAITKMEPEPERKRSVDEIKRGLKAAEKFKLIKATDREMFERTHNVSTIKEE